MKRVLLTTAVLGMTLTGIAQEKYVTGASMAINANNIDEAKENIDKAMSNAEMQEKPKALFVKGEVYIAMMGVDKYKSASPYREGAQALMKLAEIKPEYEKEMVDLMLAGAGSLYFNDGVKKFGEGKTDPKNYTEAMDMFKNVLKIHDLNGGKRFEKFPMVKKIDTTVARSSMYISLCNYYAKNYADAIPQLVAAKDNPITKANYLYEDLIDAYEKTKEMDKALAVIQEARAAYPADQNLRNDELNYYMMTGKQDDLMKKLEVEAAKDPTNSELMFSLAIVYTGMANPKTGDKPANAAELMKKADAAYLGALKLAPENADLNYNYGAMLNNDAKEINDQMNALGTSKAEMQKYDVLKAKRDALFDKALPYVEKAYTLLDPKAATLKGSEKNSYTGSLKVLSQIYTIQNKTDKLNEIKKKMGGK